MTRYFRVSADWMERTGQSERPPFFEILDQPDDRFVILNRDGNPWPCAIGWGKILNDTATQGSSEAAQAAINARSRGLYARLKNAALNGVKVGKDIVLLLMVALSLPFVTDDYMRVRVRGAGVRSVRAKEMEAECGDDVPPPIPKVNTTMVAGIRG